MTPDPLQQIREVLVHRPYYERPEDGPIYEAGCADDCEGCKAEVLLCGLRLLPDGHAAVPEDVIEQWRDYTWALERALAPWVASRPSIAKWPTVPEGLAEQITSLAGGRGNEKGE